jgi:hypothetical protein
MYIDLALWCEPVNRIPKIKNQMMKLVENHIYEMGMNAIKCISGTAINVCLILVL